MQVGTLVYVFYGSMGILAWKCGSQLSTEIKDLGPNPNQKQRN